MSSELIGEIKFVFSHWEARGSTAVACYDSWIWNGDSWVKLGGVSRVVSKLINRSKGE